MRRYARGDIDKGRCLQELQRAGLSSGNASAAMRRPVYGGILRSTLLQRQSRTAAFPGLITPDEWYLLESRLHGATPPRHNFTANPSFPMSGVMSCAVCGRPVSGSYSRNRKGAGYGYYACPAGHSRIRADLAHAWMMDQMNQAQASTGILTRIMRRVAELARAQVEAMSATREESSRLLKQEEKRELKLTDGWLTGTVPDHVYRAKMDEIKAAQAQHRLTAQSTDESIARGFEHLERLLDTLKNPINIMLRLAPAHQKRFIELMIGPVSLTAGKNISNTSKCGIISILQQSQPVNADWHPMMDDFRTLLEQAKKVNELVAA
jgi:hypothetical protein